MKSDYILAYSAQTVTVVLLFLVAIAIATGHA